MTFEQILSPYDRAIFLRDFWRKRLLYIRRGVDRFYDALLKRQSVEEFLLHGRLRYPDVRLVQYGREEPKETLLNGGWWENIVAPGDQPARLSPLYAAYSQGYTLMLEAQRVSPQISRFCRRLEEALQHPVVAKIFLTPKGSQSFPVHSDTTDAFVLQVAGRKRWRLYAMPREETTAPLLERVGRKSWNSRGEVIFDQTLSAGDLLYVPRQMPHEVLTNAEDSSLHVSIGVPPLYWRDLMVKGLESIMDADPRFDEPLPPKFLDAPGEGLARTLNQMWDSARQQAAAQDALDRLGVHFCSKLRPLTDNQFAYIDHFASLTLDSRLERRPGMICHLERNCKTVKLAFPGSSTNIAVRAAPALEAIAKAGTFTPAGLPGNLSDDDRLELVQFLFRIGLLRFASLETYVGTGPDCARQSLYP